MNRGKNLFKNTMIISIGKLCTQLVVFLLLPIYTGVLTTEEYGIVDLLNTLVSLLLPIITFQVEQAVFRELIEYRSKDPMEKKYISNGFFSIFLQSIIFSLLFFIISPFIHNQYNFYLYVIILVNIFNSLLLQVARGLGDIRSYSIGSFIIALFTIIFNIIFLVVFKFGVYGMLFGTLLGQFIGLLYLCISLKIFKKIDIKLVNNKTIKDLLKYSLPMVPNQLSWWIFNLSDRVIVSMVLGLSATGILSASNKFPSIIALVFGIFNLSLTESISLHINDKDFSEFFNKIMNFIIDLFTSFFLCMIAFMPFLYPILINEKFMDGYLLVPILLISSLLGVIVSLLGDIYIAKKNTKEVAKTSLIAALINFIINILFIKLIGLYAAALSTLAAYFVMLIYRIIDVNQKYLKIGFNKPKILMYVIMCILIYILYYINNLYTNVLNAILIITILSLINKKNIKYMIGMFRILVANDKIE